MTESVSSPDERRNLNELAFESDRREWDKEEVSQALMRHEKKARPEHDLAFLGEIAQLKVRGTRSISPSVLELERQPPCVAHKLQVPKQ